MLSIQNVCAGYGTKVVLRDISMKVAAGEFLGLIGPNGSGKTTLLRLISGVLSPRKGQILVRGRSLRDISRRELARIMAFLPQDITLSFPFAVHEVALMGRSPHLPAIGRETRKDLEIAERALKLAGISHLADRIITEISGGERQRTFIAMCLAQQPEVLLLDEPTNHLDIAHQLSTLDLIQTLNRRTDMTVISVFHDLNLAAEYCDKLVVINDGRVEAIGTPEAILTTDMISKVYRARVLTRRNPASARPHIILSAGMNHLEEQGHVVKRLTPPMHDTGAIKCEDA